MALLPSWDFSQEDSRFTYLSHSPFEELTDTQRITPQVLMKRKLNRTLEHGSRVINRLKVIITASKARDRRGRVVLPDMENLSKRYDITETGKWMAWDRHAGTFFEEKMDKMGWSAGEEQPFNDMDRALSSRIDGLAQVVGKIEQWVGVLGEGVGVEEDEEQVDSPYVEDQDRSYEEDDSDGGEDEEEGEHGGEAVGEEGVEEEGEDEDEAQSDGATEDEGKGDAEDAGGWPPIEDTPSEQDTPHKDLKELGESKEKEKRPKKEVGTKAKGMKSVQQARKKMKQAEKEMKREEERRERDGIKKEEGNADQDDNANGRDDFDDGDHGDDADAGKKMSDDDGNPSREEKGKTSGRGENKGDGQRGKRKLPTPREMPAVEERKSKKPKTQEMPAKEVTKGKKTKTARRGRNRRSAIIAP